jgi:hypothetical protein
MFPMRSATGLRPSFPARFGLVVALLSFSAEAASPVREDDVAAAEMPEAALIQPRQPSLASDPRAALAAIRAQWMQCREQAFGPPPLQECDDRAIHAADALLPRSGASPRLEDLEADLFERFMQIRTRGGFRSATQVMVIYSDAELAQRRAAILTGASRGRLARERVPYSLLNLLLRAANQRDRVVRELIGPRPGQSWLRRWLNIRNEDCAAYPVPRCAELLDGAFRAMLYDNLTDGGERSLPPLRR